MRPKSSHGFFRLRLEYFCVNGEREAIANRENQAGRTIHIKDARVRLQGSLKRMIEARH